MSNLFACRKYHRYFKRDINLALLQPGDRQCANRAVLLIIACFAFGINKAQWVRDAA
jgi:hypothetical protein